MIDLDAIDFEKGDGMVPVVCQDHLSGAVLMVAFGNRDSLERSLATGEMHYWSRTRGLWHKGETSGHTQRVVELRYDCDSDAILARVEAVLPACHTGSESCFGALGRAAGVLEALDSVIASRVADERSERLNASDIETPHAAPPTAGDSRDSVETRHQNSATESGKPPSYTRRLLADRNLRLKKLGEETAELVAACADGDASRATEEAADLLYHTLVAVRAAGSSLRDIQAVLARRHAAR